MLDRSHLQVLRALNECGNLSAAAVSLSLTQSALSHSIRKLEDRFGIKVWEKSGRNIRLTQAGEHLLLFAQRVLPQFEHEERILRAIGSGKRGKLRIGMECHPCYEWLMSTVPGYLQDWPDVDLDVVQKFRFDGLAALDSYSIDILITSDPIDNELYINEPVLDYELVLVVAREKGLPNFVKPKALANQNLLTFPVEKSRLDIFTHFLLPAAVEPKQHQHIETIEIMLQFVVSRRGVCTLPDWLARKYANDHAIEGLRLGREGVHKKLYLVMRKEDSSTEYIKAFVNAGRANRIN